LRHTGVTKSIPNSDHDFAEGTAFRMTDLGNGIRKLQRTSGSGAVEIKAA
jgi:hypothetical protein